MVRSLNIPLTDAFVWGKVLEVISKSSILKEGFKKDVLQSKYQSDEKNNRHLKSEKSRLNQLMKKVKQVQSSIADIETANLLKRYDSEVYEKIISNLNTELKSLKDQIEQSRLKTKELGTQKQWLDWIGKYHNGIGKVDKFSDEDRRDYLMGIIERIDVQFIKDTKEHNLKISLKLPLVKDGIEYEDEKVKSKGYRVVEGDDLTDVSIPLLDNTGKSKVLPYRTTPRLLILLNSLADRCLFP